MATAMSENRQQIADAVMSDWDRMKNLASEEALRTDVLESEEADVATRNLARLRLNERGDSLPQDRSNVGVVIKKSLTQLRMKSAVHRRAVEAWEQVKKYELGTWAGTAEQCVELAFTAFETDDTAAQVQPGPDGRIEKQAHSRLLQAVAVGLTKEGLKGKSLYIMASLALLDRSFGDPMELIESAIFNQDLTTPSALFLRSVCLQLRGDKEGALAAALAASQKASGDPGLAWSYRYPIAKSFLGNHYRDDAQREFTAFVDCSYEPELRKTLGGREDDPYWMGKAVDAEYWLSFLLLGAGDTKPGLKRFNAALKREAELPVEALKTITEGKFMAQALLTRLPASQRIDKALAAGSQGHSCLECHHCKQVSDQLRPCPCRLVSYCGEACSIAAWAEHKKTCTHRKKKKKNNPT